MLLPTLIGAVGLLSTVVEATPKGAEFNKVRGVSHQPRGSRAFRDRVAARADSDNSYGSNNAYPDPNYYNLTSTPTSSHHNTESSMLFVDTSVATIVCPTASLLIWTTTIDTTIFVTATSNFTYTDEPGNDDSTAHNTGKYALPSAAGDDETAPAYPGPKTVTVEKHDSSETEPCTDDPWFTINSTITHSGPIYTTPIGGHTTDAEKPVMPTTDCDDETATNGPPAAYTPPSGNFSTPHRAVGSTEPCDDETLSATLTSDPTAVTPNPYGNFSIPVTKPAGYTDDEASPTTSVSDPAAIYTPLPFSNASVPYALPSAFTESRDDEVSPTTPVSDSSVIYTPLPYGNFSAPNTKLVESTTISSDVAFTTPCDDDMTTTPGLSTTTPSVLPFGNTTISSTEPCDDETMTPSAHASSSTEPCDETTTPGYSSSVPGNATVTPSSSTEPCDETTTPRYSSPVPSNATATPSSSTEPCDETSTPGTVPVTPVLSATTEPLATPSSEGYVIDTSTTPVSSPTPHANSTYLQPPQGGRRREARRLARPDLWFGQ
ncbi:hypothetical protein QQX98_005869 [Neonectria punicea]|uniref:Uncharacterized protein n=1 Tax=Neonectria punicea TaxID=979145 RepID=A0ABR1H343_9HYPO